LFGVLRVPQSVQKRTKACNCVAVRTLARRGGEFLRNFCNKHVACVILAMGWKEINNG